ncbi:multidrug effflux MFS transporter [Hyphococcus sp.]|uniref:multidrug effflux MFS transporter n=1 Tax=Hyphococcus sp. TaxID=2038636 RepID=UPI002080435B|nr:MAG: Bcr/CflA family drug resistance efflux transporter [Marinicaulis sp.]
MTTQPTPALRIPFLELAAITAAVMALNALAIDMMLPALGLISDDLAIPRDNDRQLIIVGYVLANGFAQLFFGPLVDRFGRKRVLMWCFGGYILGSLLSVIASSFVLLLAARAFQGVATAGTRVASIAIVRDQCSGRRMAEVMSLAITIFMAAPILAPGIGQLILMVAPWRWIFVALLAYGAILALWAFLRLPETMAPEDKRMLSPSRILEGYREFVRNRISLGYTLASAMCFGALFGYISASEQIFLETFHLGDKFALAFAGIAGSLGIATLLNARIVSRFGMRRLAHGAILLFLSVNAAHLIAAMAFGESLLMFIPFMMVSFFALGLIGPNATALAMGPMGHNAGAAAAANGFAGTTLAGFLGGVIGSFYDGTTMPMIIGFVMLGASSLLLVLWTEKGVLFGVGEDQLEPAK